MQMIVLQKIVRMQLSKLNCTLGKQYNLFTIWLHVYGWCSYTFFTSNELIYFFFFQYGEKVPSRDSCSEMYCTEFAGLTIERKKCNLNCVVSKAAFFGCAWNDRIPQLYMGSCQFKKFKIDSKVIFQNIFPTAC